MSKYHFDAVIFDIDGVITDTASVHSVTWNRMFDDFLREYAEEYDTAFREFTRENDYLPYMDGKPLEPGQEESKGNRNSLLVKTSQPNILIEKDAVDITYTGEDTG